MNSTVYVSPGDYYGYQPHTEYNCWTSQEMYIVPSECLVIEVIDDEWAMNIFLQLIDEDEVIQEFLKMDTSSLLADKYLLAMVFTYFRRAQFTPDQFTTYNFFVALFLAHEIEEDDYIKIDIYAWVLGVEWTQRYQELDNSRIALWRAMDYRAIVSRECCEEVMSLWPDHPIWQRNREEFHDGATAPDTSLRYSCELESATESNDSAYYSGDVPRAVSNNCRGTFELSAHIYENFSHESILGMAAS